MDQPQIRRDRAESASALAAEKADGHARRTRQLKEARRLATELVGDDGTNISIVHPIRWPGSCHRKSTPRLAKTVAFSDNEIDLAEAVECLRDASGTATFTGFGFKTDGKNRDDQTAVASALAVIPNNDLKWNDWNRIGMATWAATAALRRGARHLPSGGPSQKKNDPAATEPLAALQDLAAEEDRVWHPGSIWPASIRRDGLTKKPRRQTIRVRAPRTKARREGQG